MSGHSKWATIKHKKGAADAKRGKLFSKLVKEITVAAKQSGGNMDTNPRLRLVVSKAKAASMPADNIERAIKKGTGELPGIVYEEVFYEGYAPGGVAVLVEVLTDNKNRTTAEIRSVFEKKGGSLAAQGAVARQFHKKGLILIKKDNADEEDLMELVINAGAEDLKTEGDTFEITTDPKDYEAVKKAVDDAGIIPESSEVTMLPEATVPVAGTNVATVLAMVEALEENEDVQNVYANFDIPDDQMESSG